NDVRVLVDQLGLTKATFEYKNHRGKTLAGDAAYHGQLNIVQYLHGILGVSFATSLVEAVMSGKLDMVKYITNVIPLDEFIAKDVQEAFACGIQLGYLDIVKHLVVAFGLTMSNV